MTEDKKQISPEDITPEKFAEWQKMAEAGNPKAMYNVGQCYRRGDGVDKDYKQAFDWFEKAAKKGDADAMFNVGVYYLQGNGVEKDDSKAFIWFKKSANEGHAKAMCNVGVCYLQGDGVAKDDSKAFNWFKKAADKKHADAMYMLGLCYLRSDGGKKQDKKHTFEWFEKAANAGHADAMYNVGVCYRQGYGVEKDYQQAFQYWYDAYKYGDVLLQIFAKIFNKIDKIRKTTDKQQAEIDAVTGIFSLTNLFNEMNVFLKSSETKKTIYHYTNWQALWGILEKKEIWLFPAPYMNDPSEGSFFFENSPKGSQKIKKYFLAKKSQPDINNNILSNYISSFSDQPDRLDLWRLYGDDGAGISLAIAVPDNGNNDIHSHMELFYTEKNTSTPSIFAVRYGAEECQAGYQSIKEKLEIVRSFCDDCKNKGLKKEFKIITGNFLDYFSHFFKHQDYENEKEYRMIKPAIFDNAQIDTTRGMPRPYYAVALGENSIKGIYVGPNQASIKETHPLLKASLKKQLNAKGLQNCKVTISDKPYRT